MSHLDEAKRLELKNMENLLHLYLWFEVVDREDEDWEDEEEDEDEGGEDEDEDGGYEEEEGGEVVDGEDEERRRKNEKDEQLLEALQPPLNVEKLWILFYGGNILPKWLTSLTNLRDLKLVFCENCEHLPPLGKLPLVKHELCDLKSVKKVGNEFLEIEESKDDPSSSSSSSQVTAFPKLKSLEIKELDELEEWNHRNTRKENISTMPRLSSLEVSSCNKLKALSDYLFQTTALQELSTYSCENLEELPILEDHRTTDIPRLSSLRIGYGPKLKVLPDYLLRTTTLQELSIMECPILGNRYLTFPTSSGRRNLSLAGNFSSSSDLLRCCLQ